jgi:transcriptional regulator of aromatic amino acid metabolism
LNLAGRKPSLTLEQARQAREIARARADALRQYPSNRKLAAQMGVSVGAVDRAVRNELKTYAREGS